MSVNNSIVATYASHSLGGATITKLQQAGFDMTKLFVAAQNQLNLGRELEGMAVIGDLGTLDEALYQIDIPKESVIDYGLEFKNDRFLLVAHGTASEIALAKDVIDMTHPDGWNGNVGCAVYYGCHD